MGPADICGVMHHGGQRNVKLAADRRLFVGSDTAVGALPVASVSDSGRLVNFILSKLVQRHPAEVFYDLVEIFILPAIFDVFDYRMGKGALLLGLGGGFKNLTLPLVSQLLCYLLVVSARALANADSAERARDLPVWG